MAIGYTPDLPGLEDQEQMKIERLLASHRILEALPDLEQALDAIEQKIKRDAFDEIANKNVIGPEMAVALWGRLYDLHTLRRSLTKSVKLVHSQLGQVPTERNNHG